MVKALSQHGAEIVVKSIDEAKGVARVIFTEDIVTVVDDYPLIKIRYDGGQTKLIQDMEVEI